MKHNKDDFIRLRAEGKTYEQIANILCCSKATVCYYLKPGQKEKIIKISSEYLKTKGKMLKLVTSKINAFVKNVSKKTTRFQQIYRREYDKNGTKYIAEPYERTFGYQDVINKFKDNCICYLTGRKIDLSVSNTYSFDHIIPTCKGGPNTLDNLGLVCKDANLAKSGLFLEDFIQLCKEVLEHNGYKVSPNEE